MMEVARGTIALYGDIACPWSHLATYRLHAARERLGLTDRVRFDMRAFPLELVNERPHPKRTLDAEIPVVGALDAEAGWQMWQADPWEWPVTTLVALEAVQAAKLQGLEHGEHLARALRRALFAESRCVSMRHVILSVAESCAGLDVDALDDALARGTARPTVMEHFEDARSGPVKVSPHVFLADGTSVPNPGIEMHWEGEHGVGFPIVDRDDPSVYSELLEQAAA